MPLPIICPQLLWFLPRSPIPASPVSSLFFKYTRHLMPWDSCIILSSVWKYLPQQISLASLLPRDFCSHVTLLDRLSLTTLAHFLIPHFALFYLMVLVIFLDVCKVYMLIHLLFFSPYQNIITRRAENFSILFMATT